MSVFIRIPDKVAGIMAKLSQEGFQAYLVGGSIRDALLNIPCEDHDLATNAKPEEIKRIFPRSRAVGQAFAVMLVDGLEVATFRLDGAYSDNRHPDSITYAETIEEDLARRDFTINAMAYDGKRLIDPYGGEADLKDKTIRFVGNARDRIREDALRALRACRFAAKIDGKLENKTLEAIKNNRHLLKNISSERKQQELSKMLLGERPDLALSLIEECGLLEYLLPAMTLSVGCLQPPHHCEDCWTHALETLKSAKKPDLALRLACLLHDVAKPSCRSSAGKGKYTFYLHDQKGESLVREILTDLRYSNEIIEKVAEYTKYHMRPLLYGCLMKDPALQRLIGELKHISIRDLLRFMLCDVRGNRMNKGKGFAFTLEITRPVMRRLRRIEKERRVLKLSDLVISGDDLKKEFALTASPLIGEILRHLYETALRKKPGWANRENLLKEAGNYLAKKEKE